MRRLSLRSEPDAMTRSNPGGDAGRLRRLNHHSVWDGEEGSEAVLIYRQPLRNG